jgi:sporulation protein YlmC with PRC-barrel domain
MLSRLGPGRRHDGDFPYGGEGRRVTTALPVPKPLEPESGHSVEEATMIHRATFMTMWAVWSLLLASEAWAQGVPTPAPGASGSVQDAALLRSKTLFEYRVRGPQGEDLGKIEEVMIDMEMGRVAYAVLSFGGLLGLGSKWVPVPWDAVALRPAEKVLLLKVEKEKIEKAPNFEAATLPELANRQWGAVIHTYYGYPPYWEKRP